MKRVTTSAKRGASAEDTHSRAKRRGSIPVILQNDADRLTAGQCFVITFQVMAFTQVSAHQEDAVGAFAQSIHHQLRMDHARTHDPHRAHVGRIL
jgi:hypothetical protein